MIYYFTQFYLLLNSLVTTILRKKTQDYLSKIEIEYDKEQISEVDLFKKLVSRFKTNVTKSCITNICEIR